MRPCRQHAFKLVALLCALSGVVEAEEAEVSGRVAGRGVRKAARGARGARGAPRLRTEPTASPYTDQDDYLEHITRDFRGDTYRDLDVKRPGIGDAGGVHVVQEYAYIKPLSLNEGRGIGADSKPHSLNEGRGFGADSKPHSLNEASPFAGHDRDVATIRHKAPQGRGEDAGRSGLTTSQRWIKLLAEFLKTSKEGQELLRAQTGSIQVGGEGAEGLPLPVLLVPVATGGQCSATKSTPGSDLEPPEYLPPTELPSEHFPPAGPPSPHFPPAGPPSADLPPAGPPSEHFPPSDRDEPVTPSGVIPGSSKARDEYLLRHFLSERPRAPLLPPMLLPSSPRPLASSPPPALSPASTPERLSFSHSLLIQAELTVYYADYTEPYTVWYDAKTGSSRVDIHGGTTVLYRTVMPNDEVERVQVRIERYTDSERVRCGRLRTAVSRADLAPPGLPDTEPFRFQGYDSSSGQNLERWSHVVSGQAGELGGARGEALTFRHEVMVARLREDFAVPYRYRVEVDSSLLGPSIEWHEHRYLRVREQQPDPAYMTHDVTSCDVIERATLETVDPMRAFVVAHRDSKCDTDFERFKSTFSVSYSSDVEEAIRKTLLIRSTQFVESGNRQAAPALLAVNHLSVLLKVEKQALLQGLVEEDGAVPSLQPSRFPHAAEEVADIVSRLPVTLNWRKKGAVTHVRNQGDCASCWAFAVVASIEGALFLRSGRLVALSEQQLLDCTPGVCASGKHVDHPYNRVREHGIAPLDNYTSYDYTHPKAMRCRNDADPVTKISGFVRVDNSADALKVAIARHGPTVIEVDAECNSFQFFKAGVLHDLRCNPNARDHALTAVGYGRSKLHGEFFIAKNSWGRSGARGYWHLHARSNTAGVHTAPSYPLLAADDVLRVPPASHPHADEELQR